MTARGNSFDCTHRRCCLRAKTASFCRDGEAGLRSCCSTAHDPQLTMLQPICRVVVSGCRFGYINWLWYGWGAVMINQYKDTDIKIYGDQSVLEYYSLNGISEWAFLGYSALTFVFFFCVAYIVRSLLACCLRPMICCWCLPTS